MSTLYTYSISHSSKIDCLIGQTTLSRISELGTHLGHSCYILLERLIHLEVLNDNTIQ